MTITLEDWTPYRQGATGRSIGKDTRISFATPADKAAWQRAGSPTLSHRKDFAGDPKFSEPYIELGASSTGLKMSDLPKLPTTPAGLEHLIRNGYDGFVRYPPSTT